MNYTEAIDWLENIPISFDSNYDGYELKLVNIAKFLEQLGNPQNDLSLIHVGGTNGKGSTCHIISSILQEHGFKVGLFSSPHIYDFRERIKINSNHIDKDFILEFIKDNKNYITKNNLSFFETSFAIALCYFKKIKPEYVIIEVGLGGRLDATNIINPIISVITNIGLDHKKFLGNTLIQIANEKAGIIKSSADTVIGEYDENLNKVFESHALEKNSKIHYADQSVNFYKSDLQGFYQYRNINTAIKTIEKMNSFVVDKTNLDNGINNVVKNTNLIGRWQIIGSSPTIIFDVAHNFNSIKLIFEQLSEIKTYIRVVFGTLDKIDQLNCLDLFPKNYHYYLCSPSVNRAMSVDVLKDYAEKLGLKYQTFKTVENAYKKAISDSNKVDTIMVTGSNYLFSQINDLNN
jgi:dihydrofolate synthase/folylpolyglutamate synthase